MIDIIVPFHENLDLTERCVRSVTARSNTGVRLLLIDNASTADLAPRVSGVPGVEIVRSSRNLGWVGGVNWGLDLAKSDPIVLLNNDTIVPPGWLDTMIAILAEHPDVGAAGPVQHKGAFVGSDGGWHVLPQCPEWMARLSQGYPLYADSLSYDEYVARIKREYSGQAIFLNWLSFFCVMLRRAAVEQVGKLDTQFRYGCDDEDYCLRLGAAGWRCAVALDTIIYHAGGATFARTTSNYIACLADDRARLNRKHNLPSAA
jgi:GT2 family glycosyltransferase